MQASIALTGDGPFEEVENYMDQIAEMKDKAMDRVSEVKEKLIDDLKNEMSQTTEVPSG